MYIESVCLCTTITSTSHTIIINKKKVDVVIDYFTLSFWGNARKLFAIKQFNANCFMQKFQT